MHYADETYDDNFVISPAEKEREAPSGTGRSSVDDSAEYNNKQFDRIGRLHKLQSTASQSKSRVSFDTSSMSFQLNSSGEHKSRKSKRESSSRVTKQNIQAERRRDNNRSNDSNRKGNELIHNSNNSTKDKFHQIRKINDYPKENLRKLTPAPLYPRDNYIAPVVADNGEEIDCIVQNVIRQRYSCDSLQGKPNETVKKKLWSPNNNTYRHPLDTELMDKIYATKPQRRTAPPIEIMKTTKNCDSKIDGENNAQIDNKHVRSDQFENGFDLYVVRKRQQFAEKEKNRSLNTDLLKSLNSVEEEDVTVETASDDDNLSVKASYSPDDENLSVKASDAPDDNFESDFYLTATILGEENRDEPDTVVVVTGRVQGLQVREYPREPLGRTKRTYFDVSDDEKIVLQDEIPQPKYYKRKLKPKLKGKAHMVRVGGGWMKVEHHRHHHTPLKIYEIPRDANDDKFLYIKSRFNTNKKEVPIAYKKYREEIVRG